MPSRFILVPAMELDELAAYHRDIEAALRLYFSASAPTFIARFAGRASHQVKAELTSRIAESDARSTLAVLTSLEAHFQVDFESRCSKRMKDRLSKYFLKVRQRHKRARLDEDILEGWKTYTPVPAGLI